MTTAIEEKWFKTRILDGLNKDQAERMLQVFENQITINQQITSEKFKRYCIPLMRRSLYDISFQSEDLKSNDILKTNLKFDPPRYDLLEETQYAINLSEKLNTFLKEYKKPLNIQGLGLIDGEIVIYVIC